MTISVIGLGYIGLPSAAILASKEETVIGVDVDIRTVEAINTGKLNVAEPGLEDLVKKVVKNGKFKAFLKPKKSEVFIIAVPTPFKQNYKPDLSYIRSAAKAIAPLLEKGNLVILESTVPVGTTEKMTRWMEEERKDLSFPKYGDDSSYYDVQVAHCPERVLPGQIMHELVENDRIIGGMSPSCSTKALKVYNKFVNSNCIITDCRTAELGKLVENSYRDVNIAFANELSLICDKLNLNVWNLIELANLHPRVNILAPGPGVGGHCIAVDPWFIVDSAPDEVKLIKTAREINDNKPNFILDKVLKAIDTLGKPKSELVIACLGLAFKKDVDDLRESPAMKIALKVASMGFMEVIIVEPFVANLPNKLNDIVKISKIVPAIKKADIVLLLVDHSEFVSIDLNLLSGKQIIDSRGIWN